MKNIKLTLLVGLLFISSSLFSQSFLGQYSQVSIIAPDEYRDSQYEVVIEPDRKSTKRIWIKNLIPNRTFYAIKYVADGGTSAVYTVPPQEVGDYQIKLGCVIFDTDDDEGTSSVVINLNNKTMCKGISQKDYQTDIQIGNKGVKVGDIEINKNGKVKVGKHMGIDKKKGIKVNTKKLMSGIQYIGQK